MDQEMKIMCEKVDEFLQKIGTDIKKISEVLLRKAPLCYVEPNGTVLLPKEVRERLGLQNGGGVAFVTNKKTGHIEMLNDQQFYSLAGEDYEENIP